MGEKSTGYIYLHRSVMEFSLYQDKFCKPMAWIDLLMLANHSEATITVRANPITIKRGQVGYSQESLAKRWKWSREKVRRFFHFLENEHMIEQVNEQVNKHLKSVITIVNYEYYQGEHLKGHLNEPLTNRLRTAHEAVTSNVSNLRNESKNNNATYSSKKKRIKSKPVQDNPPSFDETLAYCDEQDFFPEYINPLELWNFYVTDKDESQRWTYKDGKPVMNWKSLYRNIHNSNKRQGKVINNNYVQDQSGANTLVGLQDGTRAVPVHLIPRDSNGHPDDPHNRHPEMAPVEEVVWSEPNKQGVKSAYVRRGENWFNNADHVVQKYLYGDTEDSEPHYDCIKTAIAKT